MSLVLHDANDALSRIHVTGWWFYDVVGVADDYTTEDPYSPCRDPTLVVCRWPGAEHDRLCPIDGN